MVVERMFTARFHLPDGTVSSKSWPTEKGLPPKSIDFTLFTPEKIAVEAWRIRGPVVAEADFYDYVPIRTEVSSHELKPTGIVEFEFSHPDFDTFTLHANADTDGEPEHRYRASPHLNNDVPYDDPQLTIKPNPLGQSKNH